MRGRFSPCPLVSLSPRHLSAAGLTGADDEDALTVRQCLGLPSPESAPAVEEAGDQAPAVTGSREASQGEEATQEDRAGRQGPDAWPEEVNDQDQQGADDYGFTNGDHFLSTGVAPEAMVESEEVIGQAIDRNNEDDGPLQGFEVVVWGSTGEPHG